MAMPAEAIHPLKLISVLMQYPQPETVEAVRELDLSDVAPTSRRDRERLASFLAWLRGNSVVELQQDYVEGFELSKRCSLHLTYHVLGDSRQRGLALLRLRQSYADAGWEPDPEELPDYLPMMLEFAALEAKGVELLAQQREAIELVSAGLRDENSPYAELLDVITDSLPGLTTRQIARIKRLAAEGPPTEQVGLEPFAPPEVMPVAGIPGEPLAGDSR